MSCTKKMTFHECELTILRSAVDKITTNTKKKQMNNPEIIEIIKIVEKFLISTKRICYGGTAINNILPIDEQFYDKSVELPDYDFFSPDPVNDAKKLADIYHKSGFTEVEAKAGIHAGTFKVFVNFIPVADITFIEKPLYQKLKQKGKKIGGIYYCPPDYLRMLMFLELSRPKGNTERWEKVLKRLTILNKNYPLKSKGCNIEMIQRIFDVEEYVEKDFSELFNLVKQNLINQGLVFFGAFAHKNYFKTLRDYENKKIPEIPDFDVLSDDPEQSAFLLKEHLESNDYKEVEIYEHPGVGEIIANHYEVVVNDETVVFIYKPLACHSYNVVTKNKKKIKIATLDTLLSFYMAFLFVDRTYYDPDRILCMCQYLFDIQQKNRLRQKGLLRRFSMDCYGKQETIEDIRLEKSKKFKELKNKRGGKEWEFYFLKYSPENKKVMSKNKTKNKKKRRKKKNKTKKRNLLSQLLN
ncbi:MAG: hypothetical protein CML42_08120 [Rhodobacteraceae bacterium]|nr:hypothetical protein [Paracoccaceae bacterium]